MTAAADQGAGAPPPPPPQQGAPPPAAPRAPRQSPSVPPGEIVVIASGVLMLIFSFLTWYEIEESSFFEGQSWSAWSNAFNLFPLATLIAVIGAVLAAATAAARFGGVALPDRLAGFSWSQLRLAAGVLGTLTLLAYYLRSFGDDGSIDKGIGMLVTLLASVGLLVGAVLTHRETGEEADADDEPGGGQPSPAALVLIGAGIVILIGSFLAVASSDGESKSAWGEGFFPLYTLPALLGVIVAAQVAATEFAGARLPSLLGMSWSKIRLACSGWALVMMVCFLIGHSVVAEADIGKGAGFWIMLIAAIGLVVGSVMREQEASSPGAPPPAAAPPPPPPPPA